MAKLVAGEISLTHKRSTILATVEPVPLSPFNLTGAQSIFIFSRLA
jgi:hypothetical protein